MRQCLALRTLVRAWAQYREDRAITLGPALVGAECAAERNAFLALVAHALPDRSGPLAKALALVRRIAIRPLADEAAQTDVVLAGSLPQLDAVLAALSAGALPRPPLERLLALAERFRTSTGDVGDALAATAFTPCWAINLAALARPEAFALGPIPLPCPGIVHRRLFRADRTADERRNIARESLLEALHEACCDIACGPRAAEVFARVFPAQRSTSRLGPAWLLLFPLGSLTPAGLARALPATKAGAAKLLRQLESGGLARAQGPWAPFACAIRFPLAFPAWREGSEDA
ncbi:MAG: hypothetical protein RIS94_1020 [Pseudomonadota bacterium]